jgi:hypothetical protein
VVGFRKGGVTGRVLGLNHVFTEHVVSLLEVFDDLLELDLALLDEAVNGPVEGGSGEGDRRRVR